MVVPSSSAHQKVKQVRHTAISACVTHDNLGRSRKPSYVAMITKASRNQAAVAGWFGALEAWAVPQRSEIGANLELLESLILGHLPQVICI